MIEVIVRETEEIEIEGRRQVKIVTEESIWSFSKEKGFSFERVAKRVKQMIVAWSFNIALAKDLGFAK